MKIFIGWLIGLIIGMIISYLINHFLELSTLIITLITCANGFIFSYLGSVVGYNSEYE